MQKYVKAYYDWLDVMEALSDGERGRLITAVLTYARDGVLPSLSGAERYVFPAIRSQIDRDMKSYQESVENGKKGGRPKKGYETPQNPPEPKRKKQTAQNQYKDKEEDKDQDKDKDQEEIDSSEQSTEPEAAPEGERIITLPLNTGEEYPILRSQAEEWAELYPAVDVLQQLRAMRGWLMANPKKRKTQSGILRFVNGWLSKEQNKGPSAGGRPSRKGGDPPGPTSYDPDKFEADSLYNVPVIVSRSG